MSRPALLFDIGNVLVRFDFTAAAKRFAAQSEATTEQVLSLLAPFKDDLECGRISNGDFVAQGMTRIGFRGTKEVFIEIWSDIFTENAPMIAAVEKLATEHPLYLLSNTSGLHKEWLFAKFPVFRHFTGGVFSHEAGSMKPDEPIFRAAMETFALEGPQTLYIDDLPDNIATGRRLGLVTHHYHPDQHGSFEDALQKWRTR